MMQEFQTVGRREQRLDALVKVTGQAQYATDLRFPGMLHCKVLRSPVPHARILSIDVSMASQLPGVRAVVTHDPMLANYGETVSDRPIVAGGTVRYAGEVVAAVAADTEEIAQEAVSLIQVEYEELPTVLSPREGAKPGAPLLHPDLATYSYTEPFVPTPGTNICGHFKVRKGDMALGWQQSDRTFEHYFHLPMIQHVALEPCASIALFDANGQLTVWSGAQSPNVTRRELAKACGLPLGKVRITVPYIGGGFGSKHSVRSEGVVAALAMRCNGRPVRWEMTSEESFLLSATRHGCDIRIKTGVKLDGTIMAREMELYWETGAYSDAGPMVARNNAFTAAGPYQVPHCHVDSYCVYTNKPPAGPYRGFGVAQCAWAYESQMDVIAEELGLDPAALRVKNILVEGSESITGERMAAVIMDECLQACLNASPAESRPGAPGPGLAVTYKSTSTPSGSGVLIKLNEDGSLVIMSNGTELGQGLHTVLAQIAAEALGIPIESISVQLPDTDSGAWERSTTSSRSTFHIGNALLRAVDDVKQQLRELSADLLAATPDQLEVGGGRIYVKERPESAITFAQLWKHWPQPVLGRGSYFTAHLSEKPNAETGQTGKLSSFYMFAAQSAEVEVDEETGQYRVTRIVSAHDVGRALNPLMCEQQVEGGAVMGLGSVLGEEMLFADGQPMNPNFADYRLPRISDAPDEIRTLLIENPHPEGPYGAKGIGEPGINGIAPAVVNAIARATGARVFDLPVTPEKVWRALQNRREARS